MLFNRLIDLRPLEYLERMTDAQYADLLTDVLELGPSESAWSAVYELFALWPDNEAKDRAFGVAESHLASWDDALRVGSSASRALFEGSKLSTLARIVRSVSIYRRDDGGGSELQDIVTSERALHVTRLRIVRSEVGPRAWRKFLDSTYLRNLTHLDVINTSMGDDVVAELLGSKQRPRLRNLKLIEVGLVPLGLPAPETVSVALQDVDFSRNILGDEGAVALAGSPWLRSVERLSLRHNFIREPGARALLTSSNIEKLKQLDLSDNELDDVGRNMMKRLAESADVQVVVV